MIQDAKHFVRTCDHYKKIANLLHVVAIVMTQLATPCLFAQRGVDICAPFPQVAVWCKFIIVVVEYFTKWLKVEPVSIITVHWVKWFLWKNVVCRFEIPLVLISDNST